MCIRDRCQELLGIFDQTHQALNAIRSGTQEASGETRDVQLYKRLIASRMDAEQVVGRDEHLYRIEMVPLQAAGDGVPPQSMHIQLLSHDDLTLEDPKDEEQRWLQYIASYCLYAPTEGLPSETVAPLLKRNLPAQPDAADEEGTQYVVRNGLDIRVCLRTYRLFFVQGTEDVFARKRPATDAAAHAASQEQSRSKRWHAWLAARREVIDAPEPTQDAPEQEREDAAAGEAPAGAPPVPGAEAPSAEASDLKHEP